MPIERDKASGSFVFVFDRRIGGQRVRARKRLPRAWNQAQADAFERHESARLYAIATRTPGAHHLIDDAVTLYLKERVPHLKAGLNAARELALMLPYYQGRPIDALADVCAAYRLKATRDDGTPLAAATVRNRIRYLTAACRYAWKVHGIGDADPGARVTAPTVRNERHQFLTREQMLVVCRHCTNRTARRAIRIAFYSGMRLGEILRAEISGQAWLLRDTKNGRPRIVPMHPKAAAAARTFSPGPKITIQRAWARARDAAGLPEFHFHDLRHSAATAMANAGVDLFTLGRVLGHQDSRSTARYSHHYLDTLAAAVGKIGQKITHQPQRKTA
jgi:integrase